MAAPRQGLPVRLERAPHRGAAFALSNASKRARTRSIGSRSRGSLFIFRSSPAVAPRDQVDATVVPNVRRQCGAAPASCARLQPRQFPAHAGDAGAPLGFTTRQITNAYRVHEPTSGLGLLATLVFATESNCWTASAHIVESLDGAAVLDPESPLDRALARLERAFRSRAAPVGAAKGLSM